MFSPVSDWSAYPAPRTPKSVENRGGTPRGFSLGIRHEFKASLFHPSGLAIGET